MPLLKVIWKKEIGRGQQAAIKRKSQAKLEHSLFDSRILPHIEMELRQLEVEISNTNGTLRSNEALLLESAAQLAELEDVTERMVQRETIFGQEIEMEIARLEDGIGIAREFSVRDSALLKDLSLAWDTYLSQK